MPDLDVAFKALVAFTVILLVAPQEWFPVLKSLRIALVAAAVSFVAYMYGSAVRRRAASTITAEMAICAALVTWSILTVPLSYWPGGSVATLTDLFLKAVAFFWLIGNLVITRKRLTIFTWTLVLCSMPLAITGVMNYLSGEFVAGQRAAERRIAGYAGSGVATNPNDLALMLNLLIPVIGAVMLVTRNMALKALAALAWLLAVATVIITFSRAGFIALVLTLLLSIVALVRRRHPAVAIAMFVVALAVPPMLPSGYLDRLSTITDIETDTTGSAQARWQDFGAALRVIARNPVVGVGLGQDILALNEVRGPTWLSVHNVYLQYAVDLGLPGAALFAWLLIATFRAAGRVRSQAARKPQVRELGIVAGAVQIGLVAFAVESLFHPVAYQFYFFFLGGLAVALKNTYRAELDSTSAGRERMRAAA